MLPLLFLAPLLLTTAALPPLVCTGTCEISGAGVPGFLPPVAVIASGSGVVWTGADSAPHRNLENAALSNAGNSCFDAIYNQFTDSTEVVFTLQGSSLVATQNGQDRACASAVVVPGQAGLLTYQCIIHPQMKGGILVVPAP